MLEMKNTLHQPHQPKHRHAQAQKHSRQKHGVNGERA